MFRGWFEKGRRRICGNSSSGDLISYLSDWKAARSWSWSWSSVKAINPPCLVVCASIFCVWEAKKNVVSEQHPKHYLHKTRQRLLIRKNNHLQEFELNRLRQKNNSALRLVTPYDNHPSIHPSHPTKRIKSNLSVINRLNLINLHQTAKEIYILTTF